MTVRSGEFQRPGMTPAEFVKAHPVNRWPTPCATDSSNRMPSETVHVSASWLPKHIAPSGEKSQMRLSQAVHMWPTPTVSGNHNRKGASKHSGDGLATAVATWPTPTANEWKSGKTTETTAAKNSRPLREKVLWRTPNASDANKWSNQSLQERRSKGQQVRLNTQVAPEGVNGGSLNPTWVEWLMGWPLGWTDLKPLETAKCPCAQPQPGESCKASEQP
jgi:DNA (cytosine-5)-methyltransferase 1